MNKGRDADGCGEWDGILESDCELNVEFDSQRSGECRQSKRLSSFL
jgi:hypothetical protein